jgi:hypothetical protein
MPVNMKNNIVVILGAGFSRPAGLPLANDIKLRFDRDQKGKLLHFGSSEWMWADGKRDVDKHNGSIHSESTVYAYILNEVIDKYKVEKGSFDNYELFYQWVHDISKNKIIKNEIYDKAKSKLIGDYPLINTYEPEYEGDTHPFLFRFGNDSDLSNITNIINYLIADLLGFSQSQFNNALNEYTQFVNFIKGYDEVDIFTLNHDLLLENLLEYFEVDYSRGFTKRKSEIQYQDKDTPIAVFKYDFDQPIRVHKLHGSLDFFRFEHYKQGEKLYLEPTGKYNYFTTRNYREKHFAIRVNPITGEMLQDMNFDVVPKFITGIEKTKIIENDLMYSVLINRYEKCIAETSKVLISGYSFRDTHINHELEKRIDLNIINQNPYEEYPFAANEVYNIKALKYLENERI